MKTMRHSKQILLYGFLCFIILFGLVPAPKSLRAKTEILHLAFTGPFHSMDVLPVEMFAPHLLKDGQAWESWDYLFFFENGYRLMAQFQVTNQGPGKHRGLAVGLIIAPDGRVALMKNGRSREKWSFETDATGMKFQLAKHRFSIHPPKHTIHMENSQGRFDVEATAVIHPVYPGRITFRNKKFYDLLFLAPRMKVNATVQFPGDPPQAIGEGWGMAIHAYSNKNDYKQAIAWLRFATFNKGYNVIYWEMILTREHGYRNVPFLILTRNNRILYISSRLKREYIEIRKDKNKPHYRIPTGFRITDESRAVKIRGEVRFQPLHQFDLLDWIDSGIVRFFVKRVTHPVQYLYESHYDFDITLGEKTTTLIGSGFANMVILNKTPQKY